MKTLNQLKNQFGEILSREELKNVIGGSVPKECRVYCPDSDEYITCFGDCEADDTHGCREKGGEWRLCPVVVGG